MKQPNPKQSFTILSGMAIFLWTATSGEGVGAVLERVTHTSSRGYTRVTLSLSGVSRYQTGLLKGGEREGASPRIFIDLHDARLGAVSRAPARVRDGLLRQIRLGQFTKSVARVVLDLESLTSYKSFALQDPFRIIIDVRGHPDEKSAEQEKRPDGGNATLTKPRRTVVVVDPGHGGKDTGAIGWDGLREKDVVMELAKKLGPLLEREADVKVVLTRSGDQFIPLEERTAIANANNADLFVSLHANASPNQRAYGVETYYLDSTNDEAALRLAARENNTPKHRVDDLQFTLSDLTQTHKLKDSISLANHVQSSLVGSAGTKDLGVKKALFYVLVGAEMPCVLVEVSFITNPFEGKKLALASHVETIAERLAVGIRTYLPASSHAKTL